MAPKQLSVLSKWKKKFQKRVLEGNNSKLDEFTFRVFEGLDDFGKNLSSVKAKRWSYEKLLKYLLEVSHEYDSAVPLLGSQDEAKVFLDYKKRRFLDAAIPCDVILVRGNQRISAIIQTLTRSPYSHAAIYLGDGQILEVEPEGVVVTTIDKYISLDLRICRPVMLAEKGKKIVMRYVKEMLKKQPKYDISNIEKLLFKYWYTKVRPDVKVYIGGSTKFETYYICSGLIAHAFHKAGYPITPSLRFKKGKYKSSPRLKSVEDYVKWAFHIKKNYSQVVPADFDNSSFFASVKFLFLDSSDEHAERKFHFETKELTEVIEAGHVVQQKPIR